MMHKAQGKRRERERERGGGGGFIMQKKKKIQDYLKQLKHENQKLAYAQAPLHFSNSYNNNLALLQPQNRGGGGERQAFQSP
jgi:hypothetical protein